MTLGFVKGKSGSVLFDKDEASLNGCSGKLRVLTKKSLAQYGPNWKSRGEFQWMFAQKSSPLDLTDGAFPRTDFGGPSLVVTDGAGALRLITIPKHRPDDSRIHWLMRGGKKQALVAGISCRDFVNDFSQLPLFLVDPLNRAGLGHLESCGYWRSNDSRTADPKPLLEQKITVNRLGRGITYEGPALHYPRARPAAGRESEHWWSPENLTMIAHLPWWERDRRNGRAPAPADKVVSSLVDAVTTGAARSWRWVAGSTSFMGHNDSSRIIACVAETNPDSLDPSKATFVQQGNARMYYKILPYYYPSRLHQNHKVMCMFVSTQPLTLVPAE